MITSRLRTLLFVIASLVLAYGLILLLNSVASVPPQPQGPDEKLSVFLTTTMLSAAQGLRLILYGAVATMVIVLWNASALNKDWLNVLGYAFKGLGALLIVLLIALFIQRQELQRVVESQRKSAEAEQKRNQDADRARDESRQALRERNRERVQTLVDELAKWSGNSAARKLAVTVAGSHLRDEDTISLTMVQALYGVALYDSDESVRVCARTLLFGELQPDTTPSQPDFAEAILSLLESNPELASSARYEKYTDLIKEACKKDSALMGRLVAIETTKSKKVLEDSQITKEIKSPLVAAGAPSQASAQTTNKVREVIITATAAAAPEQEKALALLEQTDAGRLQAAINLLPAETKRTIPPRVYVHVAEEKDRTSPKLNIMAKDLKTFQLAGSRTIVPPIQMVGRIAPPTTEVRYFAGQESRKAAERLAEYLTQQGIKGVRISQETPTASDLRLSRDVTSHFEIWFAKGAL